MNEEELEPEIEDFEDNLIRPSFTRTKTDEKKALEKVIVFSIKLNTKEQKALRAMKEILDSDKNSLVFKQFALIGLRSVTSIFGKKFLKYLFKKERMRLSDYEDY